MNTILAVPNFNESCSKIDSHFISYPIIKKIGNKTALLVYLIFLDFAVKNFSQKPIVITHKKIAQLINSSIRTSIRAISYLKSKGLISVSTSPYKTNEIKINFVDCKENIFLLKDIFC